MINGGTKIRICLLIRYSIKFCANMILKEVAIKSMSKMAVKVFTDRRSPDLSFKTLRPKFDIILWP